MLYDVARYNIQQSNSIPATSCHEAGLSFTRTSSCSIAISGEAVHDQPAVDHRHIRRCAEGPIASSDDDGRRRSSSHRRF